MQFMLLAYDGKDANAKVRRMAAREAHLQGIGRLREQGHFIEGGAILNEQGDMIGSTLYADFPSRQALDAWLATDPYVTGNVWQNIEITPIRLVPHPHA